MAEKIEVTYYVDATTEAVSRRTAQYFVDGIRGAAGARGKARIAISGGHTPKTTFELLADPRPTASRFPGKTSSSIGSTSAVYRLIIRIAITA